MSSLDQPSTVVSIPNEYSQVAKLRFCTARVFTRGKMNANILRNLGVFLQLHNLRFTFFFLTLNVQMRATHLKLERLGMRQRFTKIVVNTHFNLLTSQNILGRNLRRWIKDLWLMSTKQRANNEKLSEKGYAHRLLYVMQRRRVRLPEILLSLATWEAKARQSNNVDKRRNLLAWITLLQRTPLEDQCHGARFPFHLKNTR